MDEVAATGEPLLITKHGKPVAELKAHKPPRAKSLIGLDRGRIKILGDIIAPAYDGEWEAVTGYDPQGLLAPSATPVRSRSGFKRATRK